MEKRLIPAFRQFGRGAARAFGLYLPACLAVLFAGGAVPGRAAESGIGAAWVVEWDLKSGWEEELHMDGAFSSIQVFGAYFNEKDEPFITNKLRKWLDEVAVPAAGRQGFYLTVVNDIVKENGETAALKNPDLITRLIGTANAQNKHIKDLIALLNTGPFTGLELDYERVKPAEWGQYLNFCQKLSKELDKAGYGMRVVMEPKSAYLSKPLPEGPEYVVMAYNLHGGGTKPGPKADPSFLSRLASYCRAAKIKPFPRLALATGGFSWNGNGTTTGLTENTAIGRAKEFGVTLKRDPYSYYLSYNYRDMTAEKAEMDHEVWFADGRAMAHLLQAARTAGFEKFDIWRLGGNSTDSQDAISGFLTAGK